jgi:hypothetical protein
MYRYSVGVGGGVWLVGLSTSIAILWHGHSVFLDQTNETVRGGAVGGGHRLFCVPVEDLIRCPSTSNFDNLEIALLTPVFNSGKPWNQQSI